MEKWRRRLALVLGIVFILTGIAETVRAVRSGDGGLPFWFGSLCGGGTLILVGAFSLSRRRWLSFSLAAATATMWTLVLPLLATLLLVLALLRAIREIQPANSAPTCGAD